MPFRVLLVGQSLMAKCHVGNAMLKQRKVFKVLFCKSRVKVKPVQHKTIVGQKLEVAVSPNINTPAWERTAITSKNMVDAIIYIRSDDCGEIDHGETITKVRHDIPAKFLIELDYYAEKSQGVKHGEFFMHGDMPFDECCDMATKLLQQLTKVRALRGKLFPSGQDMVSDKKLSTKVSPQKDVEKLEFTKEEQAKVTVTESAKTLPELTNDDFALFAKALKIGKAASNHIRVNVVGNQGVGKTTLVKRLQQQLSTCKGMKAVPTEALEINEVTLRCVQTEDTIVWESDSDGFLSLLNKQRMAEAISSVSGYSKEDVSELGEDDDLFDVQISSDTIDDCDEFESKESTTETYRNKQQAERKHFIQEVMNEKQLMKSKQVYISFWDFAGQMTYYTTHQAFLSQNAVYILAFDLSKDLKSEMEDSLSFRTGMKGKCSVLDSLVFWTTSIKTFTVDENGGRAPVIIVGTHGDKVSDDDAKAKFLKIREETKLQTVTCVKIDSTTEIDLSKPQVPKDIETLRSVILNHGLGIYDEKVDARWIDLGNAILEKTALDTRVMTLAQIEDLNQTMDMPLQSAENVKQFLEHLHYRGQVLYFPEYKNDDLILLKPSVLVDFMNKLMRSSSDTKARLSNIDAVNANGIVSDQFILQAAGEVLEKDSLQQNASKLLAILSTMKIIFRHKSKQRNQSYYIIPSLLPESARDENLNPPVERGPVLQIDFDNDPVPVGFYHLMVTAFATKISNMYVCENSGKPALYHRHAVMFLDDEHVLVDMKWQGFKIVIEVNSYSRNFPLSKMNIPDFIDRIQHAIQNTANVYRHHNVKYFIGVQCPEHADSFKAIHDVNKHGEFFCEKRHDVVIKCLQRSPSMVHSDSQIDNAPTTEHTLLQETLKEKYLGRLARRLSATDVPQTLAVRLELPRPALPDEHLNVAVQCFHVLIKWRQKNPESTVTDLLKQLCKTGDFENAELVTIVKREVRLDTFKGIPTAVLDSGVESKQIANVAPWVGSSYPLLMAELGVPYHKVETAKNDNVYDTVATVNSLLHSWKQLKPLKNSLRCLLSTMQTLSIPTKQAIEGIAIRFQTD